MPTLCAYHVPPHAHLPRFRRGRLLTSFVGQRAQHRLRAACSHPPARPHAQVMGWKKETLVPPKGLKRLALKTPDARRASAHLSAKAIIPM